MKYIINPFDATTSDCECNCLVNCKCNGPAGNVCAPHGDNSCVVKCETKCESNCINNCTGTNSVASPTSFNF